MELEITRKTTEHPTVLQCWIRARYWEDSSFNGEEDTEDAQFLRTHFPESFFLNHDKEGDEPVKEDMKHYNQDYLYLEIDLENGPVRNWPKSISADFGYKSCDMNYFRLLDENRNVLAHTKWSDYVIGPSFMNEWGDYFVLKVDEDGNILGWNSKEMERSLQEWINMINENE